MPLRSQLLHRKYRFEGQIHQNAALKATSSIQSTNFESPDLHYSEVRPEAVKGENGRSRALRLKGAHGAPDLSATRGRKRQKWALRLTEPLIGPGPRTCRGFQALGALQSLPGPSRKGRGSGFQLGKPFLSERSCFRRLSENPSERRPFLRGAASEGFLKTPPEKLLPKAF